MQLTMPGEGSSSASKQLLSAEPKTPLQYARFVFQIVVALHACVLGTMQVEKFGGCSSSTASSEA